MMFLILLSQIFPVKLEQLSHPPLHLDTHLLSLTNVHCNTNVLSLFPHLSPMKSLIDDVGFVKPLTDILSQQDFSVYQPRDYLLLFVGLLAEKHGVSQQKFLKTNKFTHTNRLTDWAYSKCKTPDAMTMFAYYIDEPVLNRLIGFTVGSHLVVQALHDIRHALDEALKGLLLHERSSGGVNFVERVSNMRNLHIAYPEHICVFVDWMLHTIRDIVRRDVFTDEDVRLMLYMRDMTRIPFYLTNEMPANIRQYVLPSYHQTNRLLRCYQERFVNPLIINGSILIHGHTDKACLDLVLPEHLVSQYQTAVNALLSVCDLIESDDFGLSEQLGVIADNTDNVLQTRTVTVGDLMLFVNEFRKTLK